MNTPTTAAAIATTDETTEAAPVAPVTGPEAAATPANDATAPKRTPKPRATVDIGAEAEARIAKLEQTAREAETKAEAAETAAKLARATATGARTVATDARKAAVNGVLSTKAAEARAKKIAELEATLAKLKSAGSN